jgi:hypothetical protein
MFRQLCSDGLKVRSLEKSLALISNLGEPGNKGSRRDLLVSHPDLEGLPQELHPPIYGGVAVAFLTQSLDMRSESFRGHIYRAPGAKLLAQPALRSKRF